MFQCEYVCVSERERERERESERVRDCVYVNHPIFWPSDPDNAKARILVYCTKFLFLLRQELVLPRPHVKNMQNDFCGLSLQAQILYGLYKNLRRGPKARNLVFYCPVRSYHRKWFQKLLPETWLTPRPESGRDWLVRAEFQWGGRTWPSSSKLGKYKTVKAKFWRGRPGKRHVRARRGNGTWPSSRTAVVTLPTIPSNFATSRPLMILTPFSDHSFSKNTDICPRTPKQDASGLPLSPTDSKIVELNRWGARHADTSCPGGAASNQRGNTSKAFEDFHRKAQARMWP